MRLYYESFNIFPAHHDVVSIHGILNIPIHLEMARNQESWQYEIIGHKTRSKIFCTSQMAKVARCSE